MAITHQLARMLGASRGEVRAIQNFPWPASVGGYVSGYGTRGYRGYQAAGQVEQSMQVVAVYACIRTIANAVSTLPMVVYREKDNGDREKVAATDRTSLLLGRTPHPRVPAGDFYGLLAGHLAGWGNAFVFKGRASATGPVTSLFPVLPSMVGTTLLEDGSPEYTITLPNGDRRVTRTDVLHIRGFGIDGIVGLSPIGMARKAIESMELEEDYRLNLLANDARVSGVLSSDQELSQEAATRLKASWELAHGGPGKAGGTAVLEGGMKWQQLSLSTEDMQFIAQRNYSVAEIARLFGLPPSMINAQSMDSMTYANIAEQGRAFVRDCLMSYLRRIEQALDSDMDLVPAGMCPQFNVDSLLRADAVARAQRAKLLIDAGVMTRNEARKDEDLPALPGLDDPTVTVAPGNPAPSVDAPVVDAPGPAPIEGGKP